MKILLFGVILSALPVITIGIFSYTIASDTVQNNAKLAKQQSLQQIQQSVEQVLKTTDHSLTYFVNSNLLMQTLSEPLDPSQFLLFNQIRQELTHLQTFDTGISDIVLLSKEQQWFINNVGLYRLPEVDRSDIYLSYLELPFDSMWQVDESFDASSGAPAGHSSEQACNARIQLVKQLPLNAVTKRGLAAADIPACHLGKLFSYDQDNESILIVDQQQRPILHANPQLLGSSSTAMADKAFEQMAQSADASGQFELAGGSDSYTVTYRRSDYNNWTYVSVVSLRELNKQSRAIGWFTLGTCLTLLLGALAAAWFFSQRIYSPVKKLFKASSTMFADKQPDKPIKDGFEFLTEQIHHVVDTNTQLQARLQSQVEQLKILFMLKLYQGEISAAEIAEKLLKLEFNRSWTLLTVITIQIDTLDGTRYEANDTDLLLFAINNIMEELLPHDERLTPILFNQSQTTIVLSDDDDAQRHKEQLYALAQQIQATIAHYLQLSVSIGVSRPFEALSGTQQAYIESNEALKNRMRLGDNAIIFYEELPQGGYPMHTFFPSRLQAELSDAIKVANRAQVDELLSGFFNELLHKKLGPKEYEIWTARLLIDFIQLTHSLGIHYVSFSDNQSVFEQMFKLRSTRDIQDWLRHSIIEPIIATIEERMQSQHRKISEHIISIIHAEFDQEITLDTIAARLHYNPNYISSIFRKETGIAFSEYLSTHRHQQAIRLLTGTTMSVREISETLQYNNSQNFIRSFRKIEGMTPGQYREKAQQGE